MTNTELTFDQLQTISGCATAICYGLIAASFVPGPDKVPAPDKAELDTSSNKYNDLSAGTDYLVVRERERA